MDYCISLSDILECIKSNRYNILDLIIENIIKDKDLLKIIESEIGKIGPIRQENGMKLNINFTRGDEDPPQSTIFDLYLSGNGYVWIDWGDGTPLEKIKLTNINEPISHEYNIISDYVITVYGQENDPNQKISFGSKSTKSETNKYLEKIETWGDLRLVSLSGALNSTTGPLEVPDHLPKTVKDLSYLLYDSTVSNVINIGDWDTSNVTDMSFMFAGAKSFVGDISDWDTANVTNMRHMFREAENFNGDISNWNTSKVTDMSFMFTFATNFNQDLRTNGNIWNTSNVESMNYMFYEAKNFNGDISNWNTSKVTNMNSMFLGATNFDGDISDWNIEKVTDMSWMFHEATKFNQNISSWKPCSASNMNYMFLGAAIFDQNLSSWQVPNIFPEPPGFATGSPIEHDDSKHPRWGEGEPC